MTGLLGGMSNPLKGLQESKTSAAFLLISLFAISHHRAVQPLSLWGEKISLL